MRRWSALVAICLGSFMLLMDVTIVNVALPDMARDLSSSFEALQWVIDGYALALAALLLGLGSLADRLGHRRTYLVGLAVFAVASLVCGTALRPAMLIASRVVQGAGGAAMFATTFALINASYEGRDRATAYGVWGAVSGAAAAAGPVVGGLLTQAVSWRAIFVVNAPISAATLALTLAVIPATASRGRSRIDVAGMLAFTVAAASLTFGFTRSSDGGWGSPVVMTSFAVTALAAVVFVLRERSATDPMLELSLFRRPVFSAIVSAALVLSFSAFALITYTTVWTQSLLGLSPLRSGLVALPLPVLSATVSALSGRLLARLPLPVSVGGGLALVGLGGLVTALLFDRAASWPALIPGLAVIGAGCGLAVPPMSSAATASIGQGRAGIASGAVNTARQLGQALGIALLGSVLAATAGSSLRGSGVPDASDASAAVVGGDAPGLLADASGSAREHLHVALEIAFTSGLRVSYVVAGGAAVLTALVAVILMRARRTADSDHGDGETTRAGLDADGGGGADAPAAGVRASR